MAETLFLMTVSLPFVRYPVSINDPSQVLRFPTSVTQVGLIFIRSKSGSTMGAMVVTGEGSLFDHLICTSCWL